MSTEMETAAATIGAEVTLCEEVPMVRQERWEEIRRLWVTERLPIAEIARRLDLDRRPSWEPIPAEPRDPCRKVSLTLIRVSESPCSQPDGHPAAARRELDGVGQEVPDDLLPPCIPLRPTTTHSPSASVT